MKELSRRSFLQAATGLAGAGLLAACTPVAAPDDSSDMASEAPDEMVAELEMWTEMATVPWLGAMDEIVESFNNAHPGIHVTHSGFSGLAYEQATKTAFAGGAVPDFLQTDAGPGALSAFIEAEQLLDLTDVVEESKGAIYPDALDSVLYKGRYWGAPWAMTVANLMYYNADILAEHGIDPATLTTWSAFTDACETLKSAGVTPILIGAKNAWPGGHWAQHLYIRTFGVKGSVDLFLRGLDVNHESPLRFTDPAGVRVWELIKELLDNDYYARGVLSDDYPAAFGKLFRGDGAFFQTGGWLLGEWFAQENPQIDLQFMLMPAIDDIAESNADEVSFNARTLIVPKASEHPAEAPGVRQVVPPIRGTAQDLVQTSARRGASHAAVDADGKFAAGVIPPHRPAGKRTGPDYHDRAGNGLQHWPGAPLARLQRRVKRRADPRRGRRTRRESGARMARGAHVALAAQQ